MVNSRSEGNYVFLRINKYFVVAIFKFVCLQLLKFFLNFFVVVVDIFFSTVAIDLLFFSHEFQKKNTRIFYFLFVNSNTKLYHTVLSNSKRNEAAPTRRSR